MYINLARLLLTNHYGVTVYPYQVVVNTVLFLLMSLNLGAVQ